MKIALACFASAVGVALAGCAVEPGGPSPYGYGAPPYDAWGAPYWSSPYAPYAPYGYAGSTLGFGVGGERWHEGDRDWHHQDRDWHREGAHEGHHHAERPSSGPVATAPPTHAAPPAAHAAPARPAPPSGHSAPQDNPARTFHSPY